MAAAASSISVRLGFHALAPRRDRLLLINEATGRPGARYWERTVIAFNRRLMDPEKPSYRE